MIATAFFLITLFIFIRRRHGIIYTAFISSASFILAFISPNILKPVYIFWMRLAFVLGWINTRIILFIIFYLIFTPIGIVLRIFGIDLLDRKIERDKESYWKKIEKKDMHSDYQRQF